MSCFGVQKKKKVWLSEKKDGQVREKKKKGEGIFPSLSLKPYLLFRGGGITLYETQSYRIQFCRGQGRGNEIHSKGFPFFFSVAI